MIERVLLGLVAIAAAVALAVWLGSARAEERATKVAFSATRSAPKLAQALRDARDARRLVPDGPADLLEARLVYLGGRRERSQRVLGELVRQEPENTTAWLLLLNTSTDPETARRARAAIRRLNPLLSARGG
jgi:predicted Zn-dependent protease